MKYAIRPLFIFAAVLVAMASITSAEAKKRGADDYLFEQKQWEILEFTTKLVFHPDLESLNRAAERHGIQPDMSMVFASFMVMNKTSKVCTIHLLDPRDRYLPERAGHELLHCSFGNFHPSR